MKNYIEYIIHTNEILDTESIIAILSNSEAESFIEENNIVKAYIIEDKNTNDLEQILLEFQLVFDKNIIVQKNWNALWESNYEPVIVDQFCEIIAPFHQSENNCTHTICINPGMAFGTGHHATTYMMIEQMKSLNFTSKPVLDYGTGSGVLAILSEMMHAKSVIGLEIDDWACRNAEENIERNKVKNTKIVCGDLQNIGSKKFDIILANINKNVLIHSSELLCSLINKDGTIIISGFYENDISDIAPLYNKYNLEITKTLIQNQWACIRFN